MIVTNAIDHKIPWKRANGLGKYIHKNFENVDGRIKTTEPSILDFTIDNLVEAYKTIEPCSYL